MQSSIVCMFFFCYSTEQFKITFALWWHNSLKVTNKEQLGKNWDKLSANNKFSNQLIRNKWNKKSNEFGSDKRERNESFLCICMI